MDAKRNKQRKITADGIMRVTEVGELPSFVEIFELISVQKSLMRFKA